MSYDDNNELNNEEAMGDKIDEWLTAIEKMLSDKPDEALSMLMCTTMIINIWINNKVKKIISKLNKWITRIKNILDAIAKKVGASSYSISVGFVGISITVTWDV